MGNTPTKPSRSAPLNEAIVYQWSQIDRTGKNALCVQLSDSDFKPLLLDINAITATLQQGTEAPSAQADCALSDRCALLITLDQQFWNAVARYKDTLAQLWCLNSDIVQMKSDGRKSDAQYCQSQVLKPHLLTWVTEVAAAEKQRRSDLISVIEYRLTAIEHDLSTLEQASEIDDKLTNERHQLYQVLCWEYDRWYGGLYSGDQAPAVELLQVTHSIYTAAGKGHLKDVHNWIARCKSMAEKWKLLPEGQYNQETVKVNLDRLERLIKTFESLVNQGFKDNRGDDDDVLPPCAPLAENSNN